MLDHQEVLSTSAFTDGFTGVSCALALEEDQKGKYFAPLQFLTPISTDQSILRKKDLQSSGTMQWRLQHVQ